MVESAGVLFGAGVVVARIGGQMAAYSRALHGTALLARSGALALALPGLCCAAAGVLALGAQSQMEWRGVTETAGPVVWAGSR